MSADGPLRLTLKAPLSGVVIPIDEVPDPVFAQRMVGDGVSLDPISNSLLAPCAGRIVQLHPSGHAVTLLSAEGIEVLMHIGLDTVQLKGQGFTARAAVGHQVNAGDPLIDFDAEYVATHAKSLLTPILITSLERVKAMTPAQGTVTAGADTILELTLVTAPRGRGPSIGDAVTSGPLVISNASGLHARPAAMLASRAKQFNAEVKLRRRADEVNARSVVSIMGLEINRGDSIEIVATGAEAADAVAALSQLVGEGLGEAQDVTTPARSTASEVPGAAARSEDPHLLAGIPASPGIVVGNTFQVRHDELRVVEDANDPRVERKALDAALDRAKAELDVLQARLEGEGAGGKAAIFAAHRELLDDPDLLTIAAGAIEQGKSAAFGWQTAFVQHAERLSMLKNELLAARANDLHDVGRRVLQKLTGVEAAPRQYPTETILVAEELAPSDTATLNPAQVLGLCSTAGGASSHVAILARSLDVPLVVGIDTRALDLPDGTPVILDGTKGTLRVNPSTADIARIHQVQDEQAHRRLADQAHTHEPATTLDGHRIEVAANIGGVADAEQGLALGAEAVGLLRSEFLFLHRATPPTEAEQQAVYTDVARALGRERRLIIRTLDVGGDKPLPYLPLPREDNPFLGERGIRVSLNRPELLRAQLRAILGAAREGRVSVMFPMIATLDEWRAARRILEEERQRLGVPPIEAGIMVEVASAALMADHFAREVDFFSIGTNDLTQYTLAMDRGHPRLAPHVDGLSPAVLRLIDMTVRAGRTHGKWTGICGGLAGDPQAVPLLVGLGVDELSVSVPAIPAVKAQIRRLRLSDCRALADAALGCASVAEVRALVLRLVPLDAPS
ncbi:MAG: phosphoenolpyruvate--protein phosphotransferase [Acidobacteria bacterium]|nr:phosphoenolpyruvate--protein phosphotransferase [Acidobacteriota bacterium]